MKIKLQQCPTFDETCPFLDVHTGECTLQSRNCINEEGSNGCSRCASES